MDLQLLKAQTKADSEKNRADAENKRAELQLLKAQTKADAEHKRADMERLLSLGRLHKKGQLTTSEFAQAKSNLLLSQISQSLSSESQGRLTSPITTKSSSQAALLEATLSTRSETNGNALDQILVHLRADIPDLEDTPSPNKSTTEPERQFDREPQPMRIERAVKSAPTQCRSKIELSVTQKHLAKEEEPLLTNTRMLPGAKTTVARPSSMSLGDRHKQLMNGSKFTELQEMLRQLGAEGKEIDQAIEEADNPRVALVDLVVRYEVNKGPLGVMYQLVGVAAQRRGVPPSLPSRHRSSTMAIPHSTPLHEPEPQALTESEPLIDQEKTAS
jgi:hypothetical protein